jgi:tripartite-type tricarboxylate transporter receptor subunit TctC
MKTFGLAVLLGVAQAFNSTPLLAQDDAARNYPSRPVRIIIGYTAGGGNDIIARVVSGKLAEGLGQPVIVENRPGAQSIIAAELVAKAPPDGHTILMGPSGPMTINPATYAKLPYSPQRDFVPVSMVGSFPLILVVPASLPIRSVKELIDYAKDKPAQANYASSAAPFQMAAELFNQKTGTQFTHIPFKGSNESVSAVATGQVTMTISDPPPISGPLKNGQVRALAVTSAQRHPSWPDIPTLAEAGIPEMEISLWTAFFVPAGTPPAIVKKLQDEVARVVKLPEIRERFAAIGVDPVSSTSEELGRRVAADIARWTSVAKAANIKAD